MEEEGVSDVAGASSGIMVELVKHVLRGILAGAGCDREDKGVYHLQKEVGEAARERERKTKKRRRYCQRCRAIVIALFCSASEHLVAASRFEVKGGRGPLLATPEPLLPHKMFPNLTGRARNCDLLDKKQQRHDSGFRIRMVVSQNGISGKMLGCPPRQGVVLFPSEWVAPHRACRYGRHRPRSPPADLKTALPFCFFYP